MEPAIQNAVDAAQEVVQPGLIESLESHLPNMLAAAAILAIGLLAIKIAVWLLRRAMSVSKCDPTLAGFAASTARFGLMALVAVSALEKAGVPATSFFAILGAAGFAIGFALKGTLGHLASGVVLVATRPFEVGSKIEARGVTGTVEQVRLFTTIIKTDSGKAVIPNSELMSGVIKISA